MLSDVVADLIRRQRNHLGLKRQDLAERCAELGAVKLTTAALTNIETGRPVDGVRRREVSVDELLVLAYALRVAPVDLMVPAELDDDAPFEVAPEVKTTAGKARDWIAGVDFLRTEDRAGFFAAIATMPKSRVDALSSKWIRQMNAHRAEEEGD